MLRLAQGELNLSVALNRRLRDLAPMPTAMMPSRRTVGQLLAKAEEQREREHRRRVAEAEAKRIEELEALARRKAEAWAEVEALIEQMQAKAYDEAVRLLVRLRDLARHQGEEAAFQQQLNSIYERYKRRSGLLGRLRDVGLYPL